MIVDDVKIKVIAGSGGDGAVAFNKNLMEQGPVGGTGGNGGSIYAEGASDLSLLNQFRYKKECKAENGFDGRGQFCDGNDGKNLILKLHSILMNGIRSDAGVYRYHGVRITGVDLPTANYLKVPKLILKVLTQITQKTKDIIFFSDSDGQHDPNDFWKMYDLIGDYDMVIGWKKTRHDGLARLYLSKAFNAIISFGFSVPLHDSNCGFRLMKKEVVDFLLSENWHLRHCIGAELAIRAHRRGFRVTEVEVSHETRRFGTSRSLPVKKLPLIIVHILSGLFKLKRDNKKSLTHTDGNGRFWV